MNVNTVSMKQHGDGYIRPNADLEMRSQIRSNEQLKYIYSECWDGIGEFKDFEKHIESVPNKPNHKLHIRQHCL